MAALEWIDRYGDRDGDGFVEYERRSTRGLLNQGWKDSSDAIRDRTGTEALPPIALAEVQGYVYDAKRRLAELARVRGETELAIRLDIEADALRARFDEAFWVADLETYAIALDRDKRQADAVGIQRRPVPVDRDRRRPSGASGRRRPPEARDVLGLGDPDLRVGPAGLQPDRLPHRARSGRTTPRSSPRA